MKIRNVLTFLALVLLISCGKNNDLDPEMGIIGDWELTELTSMSNSKSVIKSDPESTPVITEVILDIEAENIDYLVTFTETELMAEGNYDFTGKLELKNNQIDVSQSEDFMQSFTNITSKGNYRIEGDQMISDKGFVSLDVEGVGMEKPIIPSSMTIDKLTNEELILTLDRTLEEKQSQLGVEIDVEVKMELRAVLKRK